MGKAKKIILNKRVILLLAFIILSLYLISPQFSEGVSIRGVVKNSAATEALPDPILPPGPNIKPTSREVIRSVNDIPINTLKDYFDVTSQFEINDTVKVRTNKETYIIEVQPEIDVQVLNETEIVEVTISVFNETLNESQNVTKFEERNKTIETVLGPADIGLNVYAKPKNNIKLGLDLEGGTRVLLEPEEEISESDTDIILENIKQRLDVYGVSDVTVRTANDFFGNTYISVEIAGVNEEEIKTLLTEQGKFEAKIGDIPVFSGGEKDILFVCRTSQCSSIDDVACYETNEGTACGFRFSITLSQKAAETQAAATANLDVETLSSGQGYLSENLSLFLDGELVDQLRISSSLKGNAVTDIQISGAGYGTTKEAAREDALASMRQLQTVMITGSLPVKLEISETTTISPTLGTSFIKNAIYAGLVAMLVVVAVVTIRYRAWKIALPMALTMVSEVIIILGFASLIGWRIDMVAIAAIVIAIGSGVDDQIVITDETLSQGRKHNEPISWKQKLKKAFFIIMASYFTLVVAMIPLMFAGAGLLLGFAITTIVGVTIGVLITRPAFAAILEILIEK